MNRLSLINYLKYLVSFTFIISIFTLSSCKDQDYMFKEYVVEGGIPYLAGVSGLKADIGIERLRLYFNVVDITTSMVGIYWNEYEDSLMIDIDENDKTISTIFELPEDSYVFYVKTFDRKGNASNPIRLSTRTVGEDYLAGLSHRSIVSKTTSLNNDLYIKWANASSAAPFTTLVYTNTDDEEVVVRVENKEMETTINDWKNGSEFTRISYFSPDEQWLDTIVPPFAPEKSVMIDKSLGRVIDYSTQDRSLPAKNFYNGKRDDMWLTNGDYPEFAIIDLGVEVPIYEFSVWPSYKQTNGRADPRAPTTIRFEVSTDNVEWTGTSEFIYDNSMYLKERKFILPVAAKGRYVRFTGVECVRSPIFDSEIGGPGNKLMNLAELDVYIQLK